MAILQFIGLLILLAGGGHCSRFVAYVSVFFECVAQLSRHFVQVAPKRVLDCRVVMGDWLAVVLHCFAAFDCLCVQLLVRFARVSIVGFWLC